MADDYSDEERELIRKHRAAKKPARKVRVHEFDLDDDEWRRFAKRHGFDADDEGHDDDEEPEQPEPKVKRGYFGS